MLNKSIRYVLLICLVSIIISGRVYGQSSSHQALQAAYIFNFAKYVQWPEYQNTFVIGVYGESEIIEFLQKAFLEKRIGGKKAQVIIIENEAHLLMCNIIYLPASGSENLKELTTATKGKSMLIVTEDDLIKKGATISFIVQDERLKFKLKKSRLLESGLTASEGLLKLSILL